MLPHGSVDSSLEVRVKIGSRKKVADSNGDPKTAVPTGDPYIDGQRVWLERYGSYVQQAYNWRLVALIEAIALVCAVVGIIYLASQTKFVPYIVAVDKVGMAIGVSPAERASTIDSRVVRAQLAYWITCARSVVTDRIVSLNNITQTYAFVASETPAFGYLNAYYPAEGHSPLVRGQTETDTISVADILPVSQSSYEIQWTETIRDLHGRVKSTQTWEGTVEVAFRPPADEQTILRNPLGLYITSVNWTQKL